MQIVKSKIDNFQVPACTGKGSPSQTVRALVKKYFFCNECSAVHRLLIAASARSSIRLRVLRTLCSCASTKYDLSLGELLLFELGHPAAVNHLRHAIGGIRLRCAVTARIESKARWQSELLAHGLDNP